MKRTTRFMKLLLLAYVILKLTFVDVETCETLPGIKVETDKSIYYTDLNGNVEIPDDEKVCDVSYISYISPKCESIKPGTVYMVPR